MVIKDRIKNENLQSMLEVAPIEGKTRESHLRQFGHVKRTLVNEKVMFRGSTPLRMTGRPKEIWIEIVRKDFKALT